MASNPTMLGPYAIVEPLGRGGMGVVYRARHTATGMEVALKTLHLPHARMLACIRREIATLAQLRHPSIVRILDEGISAGIPWYSMELIEGHTFRKRFMASSDLEAPSFVARTTKWITDDDAALWVDGPTGSLTSWTESVASAQPTARQGGWVSGPFELETMQEALKAVYLLCAALSFVHGEGIVHGDLKPDNILLRPDGTPVLVDFGLATAFAGFQGRDVLDERGAWMGTIDYMAPEIHRRTLIDARADLYALGCMLYELFTGRPPFASLTLEEKMQAHTDQPPIPPSTLVDGLPETLEKLVLRLLAKSPMERPGHADHVRQHLTEFIQAPQRVLPVPRAYLYRPQMAGRADVMETLSGYAKAGKGGLICLEGESGVGKTRLLMEFARQSRLFGVDDLTGGCQLTDPSAPHYTQPALASLRGPLQMLGDRCRERGEEEVARIFGPDGGVLGAYEPQLARLPGIGVGPAPGSLPMEAIRRLVFRVLERVFVAQAQHKPVLLVLDDLQWADDLTLGFVEHLAEARPWTNAPLLVVVAWRREEASERLNTLIRAPQVHRLSIGRLNTEALGAVVADMLALDQVPPRFVAFLEQQSEGNPLFLAEYLRAAVDEALLNRDHEGRWVLREQASLHHGIESLPLPASLHDLIRRRLSTLSENARSVVQWGSVLGREFQLDFLSKAPEVTLAVLHELLERHILEDLDGARVGFVHDKVREVAYQHIPKAKRRALHLSAAKHLNVTPEGQHDSRQAKLGHHWLQAEKPAPARACFIKAAQFSTSRYDLKEAEQLYRQALALDGPDAVTLRNILGHSVLWAMGDGPQACEQLEHALTEAERDGDAVGQQTALYGLGDIYATLGEPEKAHTLLDRAMARLGQDDTLIKARLLYVRARANIYEDNPTTAMLHIDEALALHQKLATKSEVLDIARLKALTYLRMGRMEEGEQHCLDVLEQSKRLGRLDIESKTLINLGIIFGLTGRFEQAHAVYAQALSLLHRIADRQGEAACLSNMVHLLLQEQRFDEAAPISRRALALARRLNNTRAVAIISMNLGYIEFARGNVFEAERVNDETLRMCRESNAHGYYAHTLFNQAAVKRIAYQDFEDAKRLTEEAIALLKEQDDIYPLCAAYVELGHIELARGHDGRPLLAKARSVLANSGLGGENSELSDVILELEQAIEDFEHGIPLACGTRLSNLPEGIQHWLAEQDS